MNALCTIITYVGLFASYFTAMRNSIKIGHEIEVQAIDFPSNRFLLTLLVLLMRCGCQV